MVSRFVSTSDRSLLPAVRSVVAGADEAYLAVAFVGEAGVHLIAPQLRRLGGNGRLLSTTVFGSTSPDALAMARGFGNQIRVVNHQSGSYHPKVFIGRTGDRIRAVVGSGNLTGGLVTNVEAGVLMEGTATDGPP